MAYTYAGYYSDAVNYSNGLLATSVPVTVYLHGTTTLASLYADRLMTTPISNPVSTDTNGNLTFFAQPGMYDCGSATGSFTIDISPDASEYPDPGVISVATRTGAVTLTVADVSGALSTATASSTYAALDAGGRLEIGGSKIGIGTFTNTLYVDPLAGSDTRDGLTRYSALATLGAAAALLAPTGGAEIRVAGGTTVETGAVTFNSPVMISGVAGGTATTYYGTVVQFPANSSGLAFGANAAGSKLAQLALVSLSGGTGTGDGLTCVGRLRLEQVTVRDFARYNINADSTTINMNWMRWDQIRLSGSGSDAVYMKGGNTNKLIAMGVEVTSAGGWGINIDSTAVTGNRFIGGQIGTTLTSGAIRDTGKINMFDQIDVEPINLTVAAGSNGAALPQATIYISSGTAVEPSGIALITSDAGQQSVTFTGVSGNTLTGCTGGTGNLATGNAVKVEPLVDLSASTNAYWHNPTFSNSYGVTIAPAATTTVFNGNAFTQVALPLKYQQFLVTGTWTLPNGVTKVRVRIKGPGGPGGGAGSASTGIAQAGGAGGGAGGVWEGEVTVSSNLTITIAAAATGGTGGNAGGNLGSAGTAAAATTVTGTGVSLSASSGGPGAGSAASSTTAVSGGCYAGPTRTSNVNQIPGEGGQSAQGTIPITPGITGGSGGGAANATNGGGGGTAQTAPGCAANGNPTAAASGTTAGVDGTSATEPGCGGGGGGGGTNNTGKGGNGGNGAPGSVELWWQ